MAQIKISELPTLPQQLQAANFVPVIHSGTTYKISLFNYLVKNSGDETIAGVKTFSSSPIVPTASSSTQAVNYGQVVKNTGNETIAGTKTFSTSPIVPTPSYDSDTTVPATTAWVTDKIEGLTVDCSSRVAEYTGDGIPLIPDNVAGRTYFQDKWATTDGWWTDDDDATLSASDGNLIITATGSGYAVKGVSAPSGSTLICRIMANRTGTYSVDRDAGVSLTTISLVAGRYMDIRIYNPNTFNLIGISGLINGDILKLDTIYIGNGAYDTPALDRAGNGNNLTLNAVTPVNGKYGKEMSFNGSSSYAQASSPVIGTTGTVAVRFKRGAIPSGTLLSNANVSSINGLAFYFSTNTLNARFRNGTGVQDFLTMTIAETVNYHTAILTFSSTEAKMYVDNNTYTLALASPMSIGTKNLVIGASSDITEHFNGIISHFRYDSRIWTADEARAWSLNPISIDSRV